MKRTEYVSSVKPRRRHSEGSFSAIGERDERLLPKAVSNPFLDGIARDLLVPCDTASRK